MNAPQKRDSITGYAIGFLIAAIAITATLASTSQGATVCRSRACNVVHHQQAVVAAVPYPVIGYQVGQHLQQASVDEHAFRASPSKERLTYLEGYYQAKQEELAAAPQLEESSNSDPQAFSAPQSKAGQYIEQHGGNPPAPAAPVDDFATAHPTLAAKCATCHANDEAKGGFGLAAVVAEAKAHADCEQLLAIADSIAAGRMPQGQTMSADERLAAISELLSK